MSRFRRNWAIRTATSGSALGGSGRIPPWRPELIPTLLIGAASLAALAFQVALAIGRRRRTLDADAARWRDDTDADTAPLAAGLDLKAAS